MSFIKHIELLREANLVDENEKRHRIRNYYSASDELKKFMDKDPAYYMQSVFQKKLSKSNERISNNVLFFFYLTIISLICSVIIAFAIG